MRVGLSALFRQITRNVPGVIYVAIQRWSGCGAARGVGARSTITAGGWILRVSASVLQGMPHTLPYYVLLRFSLLLAHFAAGHCHGAAMAATGAQGVAMRAEAGGGPNTMR